MVTEMRTRANAKGVTAKAFSHQADVIGAKLGSTPRADAAELKKESLRGARVDAGGKQCDLLSRFREDCDLEQSKSSPDLEMIALFEKKMRRVRAELLD